MNTDTPITPAYADELRCRALAICRAYLKRDEQAVQALIGDESAILLPVLLGVLVVCLAGLIGPERLAGDIDQWLDERAARLAG
jgi:hypothetical protein